MRPINLAGVAWTNMNVSLPLPFLAIFSGSKHLRGQHVYLDDDLTRRQLEGRRSLAPRRLELKQQGHVTWWRRDTLCWAQDGSVHKVRPDLVR